MLMYLHHMGFYLNTGICEAVKLFQEISSHSLQGRCQGKRVAQGYWVVISALFIHTIYQRVHTTIVEPTIQEDSRTMEAFMFVGDTDIIQMVTTKYTPVQMVTENIQVRWHYERRQWNSSRGGLKEFKNCT